MKKTYATLKIEDCTYSLVDEDGKIIVRDDKSKTYYVFNISRIFNILSDQGWHIEFPLKSDDWYLMSKEDK